MGSMEKPQPKKEPTLSRRAFITGLVAAVAVGSKLEPITAPVPSTLESTEHKEVLNALLKLYTEAEKSFETEGRDPAKMFLPKLYNTLIGLNNWDKANWEPMTWNQAGFFTEAEFNELNLRRKKLSNSIGMMVQREDGTFYIRHDVNEI